MVQQGQKGWHMVGKAEKSPCKKYFLRLADECIQAVNNKRDSNGLTYARKAMISCGLSRHVDGRWHEAQLFPHLLKIINDCTEDILMKKDSGVPVYSGHPLHFN